MKFLCIVCDKKYFLFIKSVVFLDDIHNEKFTYSEAHHIQLEINKNVVLFKLRAFNK